MGCNWAKIRSFKIVQLVGGPMKITFEVWERNESGYNPSSREHFYMCVLRRTLEQTLDEGGEYLEVLTPEQLYYDRDKSGQLHCRMINWPGGTNSDFAVVFKCGEVGEQL